MKLLILEDESQMGGVQHSTLNFLKGLKTHISIQAHVLLPGPGPLSEACEIADLSFSFYPKVTFAPSSLSLFRDRIRLPNFLGLLRNQRRSRRQVRYLLPLLAELQPDLVLTKGMGAHINGARACQRVGVPCVWHQQDLITGRYGGAFQKWFGFLAGKYAKHIIADGYPIKAQLPASLQAQCTVVFNGVPLSDFYQPESRNVARGELKLPVDAYLIGHVARMTPWKGQHLLLQAFQQYTLRNPQAHLLLVGSPLFDGDNYWLYLKKMIREFKLEEKVYLPGYRSDLGFLLSGVDTFMYPSVEKDTSPLALITALAAGLPIGLSDIAGLREMVTGCPGVLMFENRNLDQMVDIMTHFADPAVRAQTSLVNRSWAQEHFSLEAYTQQLLTTLTKQI